MPQNPATLIWVQVTQIHKKEDKIRWLKLHFSKRATKVSTSSALRCFLFFSPLWPAAPLSGAKQTEWKHTACSCWWGIIITIITSHPLTETPARSPPCSPELQHHTSSSGHRIPAAVSRSCLQMAIQALIVKLCYHLLRNTYCCCRLDGWTACRFLLLFHLIWLKFPVWLLEDESSQSEC